MAKGFQILPGFRDFYPEDCAARNHVFACWRRVARRYGFVEYEGPILEPTELYKRKSGEEIATQLFCFEDKGDRDVSMRPELTPTLARMAAARQRDFRKPLRWFSIGQFFRYERHQKGRGREFYQFNCDILGEEAIAADGELIALAIDVMRELGFTSDEFRIRLSDRDAWTDFASSQGVGEGDLTGFLQIIDKLERTPPEKTDELLAAFDLSVSTIEEFIASGAAASERLSNLVSGLEARGMGNFVEVDLRIVRGLAYYTGIVFEVFDIGQGMRAVAGGGRYDGLVELIGGVSMPACGFAMGDMVITDLIRSSASAGPLMEEAIADSLGTDLFVVLADDSRVDEAARIAQELRSAGWRVTQPLAPTKVGKQFQAAEQNGATWAVVVGGEFPQVSLKNLGDRSEETLAAGELVDHLAGIAGQDSGV